MTTLKDDLTKLAKIANGGLELNQTSPQEAAAIGFRILKLLGHENIVIEDDVFNVLDNNTRKTFLAAGVGAIFHAVLGWQTAVIVGRRVSPRESPSPSKN